MNNKNFLLIEKNHLLELLTVFELSTKSIDKTKATENAIKQIAAMPSLTIDHHNHYKFEGSINDLL